MIRYFLSLFEIKFVQAWQTLIVLTKFISFDCAISLRSNALKIRSYSVYIVGPFIGRIIYTNFFHIYGKSIESCVWPTMFKIRSLFWFSPKRQCCTNNQFNVLFSKTVTVDINYKYSFYSLSQTASSHFKIFWMFRIASSTKLVLKSIL